MFNLLYYLPVAYNFSLTETNSSFPCNLDGQYLKDLISYLDLANRVVLSSFLIIIFSTLLGIEVIKSRSRILANFQREENEYFFKNNSYFSNTFINNICRLFNKLFIRFNVLRIYPN